MAAHLDERVLLFLRSSTERNRTRIEEVAITSKLVLSGEASRSITDLTAPKSSPMRIDVPSGGIDEIPRARGLDHP